MDVVAVSRLCYRVVGCLERGTNMSKVEVFWDVASPYTYLAITQIAGLRQRTGAEVELRPFLLGGVFKATGNTMPAAVPAKAMYMLQDLRRWRELYNVPLCLPRLETVFPISSLLPMRVAVAALLQGVGEEFCHGIFKAYWAQARDVSQLEVVREVLDEMELPTAALLAAAETQAVKDKLRANTDEAVERGAFGAPAIFVDDQLFVGNDRLQLVEAFLAGKIKE